MQSVSSPPQVVVHTPALQVDPLPHAFPHAPQFATSAFVLTQAPPQFVAPPAQSSAHAPAEHTRPGAHAFPHPPQCLGSEIVSWQPPSHRLAPPPHESAQLPAEHSSPAAHMTPHPPQLVRSLAVSTHAPEHTLVAQASTDASDAGSEPSRQHVRSVEQWYSAGQSEVVAHGATPFARPVAVLQPSPDNTTTITSATRTAAMPPSHLLCFIATHDDTGPRAVLESDFRRVGQ